MVLLDNGSGGARDVTLIAPAPDLQPLVEHVSIQPGAPVTDWRIVPDASPHLIVVVDPPGRPGPGWRATVVGPRSTAIAVDVSRRLWTIGVRLRPGALPALVGIDAHELADRAVALEAAFAQRAARRLAISPDDPPERIARALLQFVRDVRRPQPAEGVWTGALAGAPTVSQLAEAFAWSPRTTHARVRRTIGLRPKLVLRIVRLHRALALAHRRPALSWADVAQAAGYADQPHFTRECRSLLGETPRVWRGRGAADSFKTPPGDRTSVEA